LSRSFAITIALLSCLHFVFVLKADAQPYYFRHYQVENGLSNNSVFCSVQDHNGFLWFGTKDGLNRFDGYRFKVFNVNSDDERSLTNDFISCLAIDKRNRLWIGSSKGLYRFDEVTERLIPVIDSLKDINDVYIDDADRLWFTSIFTACRYDLNTGSLTVFPPAKYFNATSLFEAGGRMWFSTMNGFLEEFDPATEKFTSYNMFDHSPRPASYWIEKIAAGSNGTIYVGTSSQGLKQFDLKTHSYQDILTYNDDKTTVYVRDMLQVAENEFWFATESGIFILNTNTGKFTNLRKKYLDPYSLSDNAIYTLHKDIEGGIWAGTYFGGVNYFPKRSSSTFQKFFPDYTPNSISGNVVREICEDHDGNIWIGTEDAGLNKLNPKTGEVQRFMPSGAAGCIAYSNIHGLLVVNNDLWIGTFEHGLDILDIGTGRVRRHYSSGPAPGELKSNFIVSLLLTKRGDIYVGSSNSVYRYDPAKDGFELLPFVPQGSFISCLLEDHDGVIWVGTHSHGIYFLDPTTGKSGHFENEMDNKNSLTTNTLNALFEDDSYNLWLATEGGGLCQLSKDRKTFTRFTTKNGLPSNFVFKVLEDDKKNLWITTSKGLVNFVVGRDRKTIYTHANGLLNDQFNYNSGLKDANGKLYFGSVKGMITFDPDITSQSRYIPPVFITGFQVNNIELDIQKDSSLLKRSILETDKIVLAHDQSSFSIDFAAISFTSPEMTEYRYIMEGLDDDWTYLKSNRKVYFTSLKPGTYTFRVRAASNEFSGREEKRLTIKVLPPFWATPWAYLLYVLTGAALFYYLVRTYHNRQENKKEKEIYEAKIEFFINIAHEIKTPLTLIKGPVENLSEMVERVPAIKDDVQTMERNTNRLVNLVNQIMDFRQTETKGFSLDFSYVNISDLLRETFLTFEPYAKKRSLDYHLDMPAGDIFLSADDEAMNKIFSNLFSNAVKYADKIVEIKVIPPMKEDSFLSIEFRNDGFVIPPEMNDKIFEPFYRLKETIKQKGTGIGLALARSLVELHQGKLYLEKPDDGMNIFVLMLPVSRGNIKKTAMETKTALVRT
jgi:ligand-binding sensor domain-containing protein/signal transduction histidine kinase